MIEKIWAFLTWPFRQVYEIIKHLILDSFGDVKFIIKAVEHKDDTKPFLNRAKVIMLKEEMKKLTPAIIIKDYGCWFLLAIFTLCMGYIWGLAVCKLECNNYVVENFINNPMVTISNNITTGWEQLNHNLTALLNQ